MKIFEILYRDGEQQWVASTTNIDALRTVLSIEDTDLNLMQEIKELPEDKWDENHVVNNEYDENNPDDWEVLSFRDYVAKECSGTSCIISSTFYE